MDPTPPDENMGKNMGKHADREDAVAVVKRLRDVGHVAYFAGGQEDLKKRLLRAIGEPNRRFEEDHLRLLRAVRFAARFGLRIDAATGAALAAHADHLKRISPERIAEELRLMLGHPTRATA